MQIFSVSQFLKQNISGTMAQKVFLRINSLYLERKSSCPSGRLDDLWILLFAEFEAEF